MLSPLSSSVFPGKAVSAGPAFPATPLSVTPAFGAKADKESGDAKEKVFVTVMHEGKELTVEKKGLFRGSVGQGLSRVFMMALGRPVGWLELALQVASFFVFPMPIFIVKHFIEGLVGANAFILPTRAKPTGCLGGLAGVTQEKYRYAEVVVDTKNNDIEVCYQVRTVAGALFHHVIKKPWIGLTNLLRKAENRREVPPEGFDIRQAAAAAEKAKEAKTG